MIPLIFFGAMIVLFWVLIVMPQRRRRQVQQQLQSLEPGDEVPTIGGLFGTFGRWATTMSCSRSLRTRRSGWRRAASRRCPSTRWNLQKMRRCHPRASTI